MRRWLKLPAPKRKLLFRILAMQDILRRAGLGPVKPSEFPKRCGTLAPPPWQARGCIWTPGQDSSLAEQRQSDPLPSTGSSR